MLRNAALGGGVSAFPEKELRRCTVTVISITRGWVKFPGKKRYVTLEWPTNQLILVNVDAGRGRCLPPCNCIGKLKWLPAFVAISSVRSSIVSLSFHSAEEIVAEVRINV